MSNIYVTTSNINNVSSTQRKRIFDNTPPNQVQNHLQLPTQKQPDLSVNSLNIDPELSYIAPIEIEQQKPSSKIEGQIKSEIRNDQISQEDPAKQSLLKDVQLENLENIFTLFRSTVPMNQSNLQSSRLMTSNVEPQYYQQLEIDAENIRDRIKMEGRTVHTIIEKHSKIKQQKLNVTQQLKNIQSKLIEYDQCTSYSKFQREIKYEFNQFESKADELRDLFNEAFNFMSVISVAAYERLHKPFDESEIVSEAEFTSVSLKHFSDIELIAKEYEQTLSEKRRLGNINQNHQQYKSICSKLLQLIKSFPQLEQEFQQKMINLQRVSSIYFKGVSRDIQICLSNYQLIIQDYRLSLASIDKIAIHKDLLQEYYDSFDYYQYLIFYLNQQPQNYKDNYYQFKYQKDEIKFIHANQSKYFFAMKNKIYQKSCLYIDNIQNQINTQKTAVQFIIPLIDQFKKYKNNNFQDFFDQIFNNLQQSISKDQWQHLINLYQEIQQSKCILKKLLVKLNTIQQQHPTLSEFKEKFIRKIETELKFIDSLNPKVEPYLNIQDIDIHVQYLTFKENYQKQRQVIDLKIQEIIINLPQQLQLSDIESQNLKKINIEKFFSLSHQLEQTAIRLQRKKVSIDVEHIRLQLQQDIIFEKDVICLLESMQYLHTGNLQMIVEDFNEIDQKNNNSSLQQLIEVVIESEKKIELIQSDKLQDIKQIQVQGFKWILNLFKQYDQFRKNLIKLIFQMQKEEQIEYSRTIDIQNFEDFIALNRFSHLFYYLNQYPRKYQHWAQIKNELIKVIISSFKISNKKVMEKIDVLGGDKPINLLQFDQDNIEKILKWFQLEQNHSNIAKAVLLYQGYKKTKISNSQFSSPYQQQDQKQRQLMEIQTKMFDVINKLKDQIEILPCEVKFAYHNAVDSYTEEEFDKIIFTELQEEWVLDYMEKGQDLSFLADLQNNSGIFDTIFLNQSLIFINLNQILQTQNEIDVKQIRSNLFQVIKHQT
ncbi:unnamed protein product [Paramecium primaurelia]|uniref:Uncharacterized protein n=1 Tax=Paramecium primaurelia TaxID=5886 RepID=A0A8S1LPI1_PARPR|nr:unnamed protein product [Paramecium primaurelia]